MPDTMQLPGWKPQWPSPARVGAFMTVRQGGVSAPPWDSMNLGEHVGDDRKDVASNRSRLSQALQVRPFFLEQVHGSRVVELADDHLQPADASLTDRNGWACTVMVADCLPVLLCDRHGRWVAAAHAGWRGLAGEKGHGVLESLVESLKQRGVSPVDLLAWLGPCIGPQAFEVGPEVVQALCPLSSVERQCVQAGRSDAHFMLDLAGVARHRLKALGVASIHGNDSSPHWCTAAQSSLFFSHRRDSRIGPGTGRMAALIWLNGA
jgi:YfiH family protein